MPRKPKAEEPTPENDPTPVGSDEGVIGTKVDPNPDDAYSLKSGPASPPHVVDNESASRQPDSDQKDTPR